MTIFEKADTRVAYFIALANELFDLSLEVPYVDYLLKGSDAGRADSYNNSITLNGVLFKENFDEYMSDTIPHEVAHIVCDKRHGLIRTTQGGISSHGKEWKAIMVAFGCEPSRCHTLDTTRVKRKMRKFSYFCPDCLACMPMSAVCHNRATKGREYIHKGCKSVLQFIEEIK